MANGWRLTVRRRLITAGRAGLLVLALYIAGVLACLMAVAVSATYTWIAERIGLR